MVSRRDELLSSLDSAFSQLRSSFNGLASSASLDPPTAAPPSARRPSSVSANPTTPSRAAPVGRTSNPSTAPALAANGDELPTYAESRRAHRTSLPRRASSSNNVAAVGGSAAPPSGPYHTFTFRSSSGKATLKLQAPVGRRATANGQPAGSDKIPVLVQGQDRELKGEVILEMGDQGEPVSEIRVKCKGVVKTLVLRQRGGSGSRVPLVDENVFLQSDRSLYQPPPSAPADTRLVGTHAFPFSFTLPPTVPSYSNPADRSAVPLPPSFALTSPSPFPSRSAFSALTSGAPADDGSTEWASVKYYLKLTIAKKGLFKLNDRLFVPFVLLSSPQEPGMGFTGDQARWEERLERGTRIGGPTEEPAQWLGRKVRRNMSPSGGLGLGSFRTKKREGAWYEVIALLPAPPVYNRRVPIPFFLKIASSDPTLTSDFPPPRSIEVQLIQRVSLQASGAVGVHENPIGKGYVEADGSNGGVVDTRRGGGEWARKVKGEVRLNGGAVPNFVCPNISVEYVFVATVKVDGANDSQVVLPVRLVSSPKRPPQPIVNQASSVSPATAPPATPTGLGRMDMEVDLPPSYFEVQEMDAQDRRR